MKQKLVSLAFGALAALVLAELLGLSAYYRATGRLYYAHRPGVGSVDATGGAEAHEAAGPDPGRQRPANRAHPFFGYVKFPRPGKPVNAQGFVSAPLDYPLAKSDDAQYFIGIFGGSLSAGFADAGSARLVERLKAVPAFRGRRIEVLNFGSGGYKQPQQLLILSYFLAAGQALDMVINIDGFNEVALSRLNREHGIDVAMPSADHILPLANLLDAGTLTPERIEALARIHRHRGRVEELGRALAKAPMAILWFVEESWRRILMARLGRELLAYQQLAQGTWSDSLYYVYPAARRLGDAELYASAARLWSNASLLMHEMLRARQIRYFHFLQPNQYHSRKVFGAAEAAVALRPNHPYRIGVEKGYPVLESEAELLRRGGVHFFSAVPLFDQETQAIYKDDCCHLNQRGNDLLADFVAASILGTPEP